jgi:hypothetical protein
MKSEEWLIFASFVFCLLVPAVFLWLASERLQKGVKVPKKFSVYKLRLRKTLYLCSRHVLFLKLGEMALVNYEQCDRCDLEKKKKHLTVVKD